MEWSKAKTLLILLMLAVNLFLGVNIYVQVRESIEQEEKMTLDACAVLEQRGFELNRADILALPAELPAYTYARDIAEERVAALRLLGQCSEDRPGGGIYAYTGEEGTVIFRSGGYVEVQPAEGAGLDLATLLRPAGEDRSLELTQGDESFGLQLDGRPVVGASVTRSADGAWSGTWVFAPAGEAGEKSLSRASLLLAAGSRMEQSGMQGIEAVQCVYVLTAVQSGDVRLVPAWQLNGSGQTLWLSMLTGETITFQQPS